MAYEPEWQWLHDLPTQLKGIVEYLAEMVGNADDIVFRKIGVTIIVVILILVVHNRAKIFTSNKPTKFSKLWERFLKGENDE